MNLAPHRRAPLGLTIAGILALLLGIIVAPWVFAAAANAAEGHGHDPVTICHKPGTPAQHELTVDDDAVPAHLEHGDTLGACPVPPVEEPCPDPTTDPEPEPTTPPAEPTDPPTDEPTTPPTDEPTPDPTDPPVDEPTTPPTDEPTAPPVDETPAPEPVTPAAPVEPAPAPVVTPIVESATPTPETVTPTPVATPRTELAVTGASRPAVIAGIAVVLVLVLAGTAGVLARRFGGRS